MYKLILLLFIIVFLSSSAFAGTLAGKVTAKETGEPLVGANVYLKGTTIGAATDEEGMYYIRVDDGSYDVVCDYVGYATVTQSVEVSGETKVDFVLTEFLFAKAIDVFADRAVERETPVAYTNVDKIDIENRLGSQDVPLVLNTTPSVYSTMQGGGAGDARINVRGFTQRNMAVMINGVPVNDMENGWVYWSNWDGLGDATSSIQVQRGLSAVNLATPSIGGTMNILTDPTAHKAGISYKDEIGSGNFRKRTLFANTGLIDNKFALTLGGVRKTGEGLVDGAWTDAWAYYLGTAYQINDKNRIELYATGAPQRHGQRRWKLNAATFSHELAKDLGFDDEILDNPSYAEQGLLYNSNWSPVSSSYQGSQYWDGKQRERHSTTYINESENYYHKPIVNFNWYSQFTDKFSLYTTAYYSGGKGGGTGTFGSLGWNYSLKQRVIDYDATITRNVDNVDTLASGRVVSSSRGILRNSVNTQWTIGLLSKAYYQMNEDLKFSFGLDWRTAQVEHYREVRDLIGGDVFYFDGNEFDSGDARYKTLGEKIDYNFTNKINWIGGYAQSEYTKDKLTAYGTAGISMIKYDHTNHFMKDTDGSEISIETDNITGGQLKGGLSYRLNKDTDIYTNLGYVSKVPLLDAVINDYRSELIEEYENETFYSFEVGSNIDLLENTMTLGGNVYYTIWNNRTLTQTDFDNTAGIEGLVVVTGLDAKHMGVELTGTYHPVKFVQFDIAASLGNWENTSDADANYKPYSAGISDSAFTVYTDGIKIGDAPQTQLAAGVTVFPVKGMDLQLVYRFYDNYYADWNALSRGDANDTKQSWQIPSYNLVDLHFSYKIPTDVVNVKIFAHVFNLLDELYVQDATDNSQYNGYSDNGTNHSADDAEIYPGLPRSFNLGIQVGL